MQSKKIFLIGSSGFVGRHTVAMLAAQGYRITALSRSGIGDDDLAVTNVKMPDLEDSSADWRSFLSGADIVIHAAGLAHSSVDDPRHDAINHRSLSRLVAAAIDVRVDRFVYISSLAAQVGSCSATVLTERDEPRPVNAYGRAKLAAEQLIRQSGIEYTILRPTVIYGDGAKGNPALLEWLSDLRFPLPIGSLDAPRSMLSVENLARAILLVIEAPSALNETFLVADPNPLSVKSIVEDIRRMKNRPPLLIPFPPFLLKAALVAINQRRIWERIGEPLVVSCDRLLSIGWVPVRPAAIVGNTHRNL